tara:strand:+ start:212 stop:523 length:312 start_codon:yes stop_codon:yes gene_type:complete
MNKEYWQRKADLCQKIGIEQLIEGDIPNGTRNLKRMVRAMEELNLINYMEKREENCIDCGRTVKECEADEADCGQMEDKSADDMWVSLIASGLMLTKEGESNE